MTLKEFAAMLDGREYLHEITKEEETLAKELGFVVVFGYSDDNAEMRGAINDEIGCYDGGVLEHKDLPRLIHADWCPKDMDCSWAYRTSILHEKFHIYEDGELYCVGIVCDIRPTNADRIRAMSDMEIAKLFTQAVANGCPPNMDWDCKKDDGGWDACDNCWCKWLQQPAEVK